MAHQLKVKKELTQEEKERLRERFDSDVRRPMRIISASIPQTLYDRIDRCRKVRRAPTLNSFMNELLSGYISWLEAQPAYSPIPEASPIPEGE